MRVFLSWSGSLSRDAAVALGDWLPRVINEVEPFVSSANIAAGARWQSEIASQLDVTNFGVVCVTRSNQSATWLNFEAGALAKSLGSSRVVPLAIDLQVAEVDLPLAQFQALDRSKAGISRLLASINEHTQRPLSDERLRAALDLWWPRLDTTLEQSRREALGAVITETSDRAVLEEVLTIARKLLDSSTERGDDSGTGQICFDVATLVESLHEVVPPTARWEIVSTQLSEIQLVISSTRELPAQVTDRIVGRVTPQGITRITYKWELPGA